MAFWFHQRSILEEIFSNSTTTSATSDSATSAASGFAACAVAAIFFGSNFIPVKKYTTGDGFFFQWIMCLAIFTMGFLMQLWRGSQFEPYAALGGAFWATGNILSVPIIQMIGLGLGMLIWGIANLATGWASGQFGFFGINKQTVHDETLNYVGVSIICLSLGIMYFIKPEPKRVDSPENYAELSNNVDPESPSTNAQPSNPNQTRNNNSQLGFPLAIVAGCFFGICFDPAQYLIDHSNDGQHSTEALDYVFSQFCGIFMASTFYFLCYCVYKNNKPALYPELVLPAFLSGAAWAVAQTSWFIANENLKFTISFPIITISPGLIANLWGVFVFEEITGRRNFTFLISAFLVASAGILCIVKSR